MSSCCRAENVNGGATDRASGPSSASSVEGGAAQRAAVTAAFGARVVLADTYADLLCTAGVERGLLGPREGERIWDRHLLNSALVAPLVEPGARVCDLGSGAGLPGIVIALARPDVEVTLVESMARRAAFLMETISLLGLAAQVRVHHGRAEVLRSQYDALTARAVGPLDRLAQWAAPLTVKGGRLLAMRGSAADAELTTSRRALSRAGWSDARVLWQQATGVTGTAVVCAVRR